MSKGKLDVVLAFVAPMDVRKENRDRAPWGTRTERVLFVDDISKEDAEAWMLKLRERNPGLTFNARWEGPVTL